MAERLHRLLKAGLSAANNTHWTKSLLLVLLGIRNALKTDAGGTNTELVYGTTLRLLDEFISPSTFPPAVDCASYVSRLTNAMRSIKLAPLRQQSIDVFVHPCLKSSHVFVRRDSVRRPFEPPYDGSHKVIKRIDKFFALDKNGREDTISIDHLKPAFLEGSPISLKLSIPNNPQVTEYPLALEEITSTEKASEPAVEP
ncbi:unnamed protein product [Trichobilharzia regenti]|nr:unnamed protein product [Trichobilharzia regenti]